jgi:hypothetical protein
VTILRLKKMTYIKYHALFVNDSKSLMNIFPPIYDDIYYHHSTIQFEPQSTDKIEIGKITKLKIIGQLTTSKVDVLLVENPKSINQYPHITLSTTPATPPVESNSEIKNNLDKIKPINLIIDTIEGIHNGKSVITSIPTQKS